MTDEEGSGWHREVIPEPTEVTLCALRDRQILDKFYLAGGTGLALQFGHRLSLDLNFFASKSFNEDRLLERVQEVDGFALVSKAPETLHANIQQTKVSFLGYPYPVLFPQAQFMDVAIADPRDIACMKVSAVAGRGTKRDFVDLYVCARRYGLQEILQMFSEKFAKTNYNRIHILKSLSYFIDAEKDPMPQMLAPLEWDEIKQFFAKEAPRLL